MIKPLYLVCFAVAFTLSAADRLSAVEPTLPSFVAMMQTYCMDCHNSAESESGLNLEGFDLEIQKRIEQWDSAAWEIIAKRLRGRQMPPADAATRPTEEQYVAALSELESMLDEKAANDPQPGRTAD